MSEIRGTLDLPNSPPASNNATINRPARRKSRRLGPLLAIVVGAWSIIPILWMTLTAFKPQDAIKTSTPTLVFVPTLDNFKNLFTAGNNIAPYILNSVIASVVSTLIAVGLGSIAGYGLAHWKAKRKKDLAFWILSTRMAPIAAVIVPLFFMFRTVGLVDSVWGLVIAYLSFNLPFAIWLMQAFFAQVPPAIEEAAMVDGCSRWQAFTRVAVPTTIPGIVTTAVLCMVFAWNDYAFASSLGGPNSQTLPMSAGNLITQGGLDWGQLSALGVVVALPMLIGGLAVRRHLVTGMTLGAVTGE